MPDREVTVHSAGHGHETHGHDGAGGSLTVRCLLHDDEPLHARHLADGNDDTASRLELGPQERRQMAGRAGDDDGIEGSCIRPAEVTVALAGLHRVETLLGQQAPGPFQQGFNDLHGVYVRRQVGEHGGLVARSRADLEDPGIGVQFQQFGHERDDVGLGDGLPKTDGQRRVVVGETTGLLVDEHVTGYGPHGL